MVANINNKGYRDYLWQRITAIYMSLYLAAIVVWYVVYNPINYELVTALSTVLWFKLSSLLFIIAMLLHAWIGMWTVVTDYIKCPWLRKCYYLLVLSLSWFYVLWTIEIFWGIYEYIKTSI